MREDLLAAVYANPADDGARQVYGDALLEAGDPRGELIALQFKKKLKLEEKKRVRELLKQHAEGWLGDLAPLFWRNSVVFARGFLAAGHLTQGPTPLMLAAPQDAAWSTVERLVCTFAQWGAMCGILRSPHMRSLRVLGDVDDYQYFQWSELYRLCEGKPVPAPIEEASVAWEDDTSVPTRDVVAEAVAASLPRLVRLGISGLPAPYSLDWLWDTSLGRRLERLTVSPDSSLELAPWLALADAHPSVVVELRPERPFTGYRVEVRPRALEIHVEGRRPKHDPCVKLTEELDQLPEDALDSVVVHSGQADRVAGIVRAARRQKKAHVGT
jgi:uncharacterized protein (TIGR02996 family)